MSEIVFFLEEPSAEALLQGLLPRILPQQWHFRCIVFEGKQDLEKQLIKKMNGYRVPDAHFIVLRDKDSGDCRKIKEGLLKKCHEAGKTNIIIRIVCHELESWYLGDLAAVEIGFGITGLTRHQAKNFYSNPDAFPSPSKTLRKLVPQYQKIGGSRAIGPHLDLNNFRSNSFKVFIEGIRKACA
jgi:hypothetical protein